MPAMIRLLTPDGLHPAPYRAESLAEAAAQEPADGVYTVTNTYDTYNVLKLDAHLDRMEDSARRAGITLTLDRPRLRAALRQLITEAGYGDVRFRVTASRQQPDTLILSVEPFKPLSAEIISAGVRVVTAPGSARHNPAAKTTDWMHQRTRIADALPPGIYDAILLDDEGHLLEGLAANFYAIKDQPPRLYTAGEGVLPGIAQQIVFAVAPEVLPLATTAVHVSEIAALAEAFITSSSRGIVPVVEIDGHMLGDGQPGPYTRALRAAYQAWVAAHVEAL